MGNIHAVSVVAFDKGRFLLIQRAHPPMAGQYAFPGGKVDPGETEEDAARRELLEETSLTAGNLIAIEQFLLDGDDGHRYRLKVFHAQSCSGHLRPGDDALRAGWYAIDEIRALPVTGS